VTAALMHTPSAAPHLGLRRMHWSGQRLRISHHVVAVASAEDIEIGAVSPARSAGAAGLKMRRPSIAPHDARPTSRVRRGS
jgi:hypothetical protein